MLQVQAHRQGRKALWVVQEHDGNQTAFALVLAGYGDAWAAVELGRGMGPSHTLLALQPPDADGGPAPGLPAAELAALYVRQLTAAWPHEPYFLGGYSAGAILALEMARQLRAQGRAVGLVAMFDPLFLRYSLPARVGWRVLEWAVRRMTPVAGGTRPVKILSAMTQDPGLRRHLRALEGYDPQPYDGRVVLIEADWSPLVRTPFFLRGWRRIARGGLDRWHPGGTHHGFMRPPHVGRLGRRLAAWMAQQAHRPAQ
jgi:thioesterase domain-containing protein